MAAKKASGRSIGPITQSTALRAASEKEVTAVRESFPNGVAAPALRALVSAEYTSLDSLAGVREADLAQLHGMGPKALELLKKGLADKGLCFAA